MAGEYRYLARVAHGAAKVTLPSPSRLSVHGGRGVVDAAVYPDLEAFYADVGKRVPAGNCEKLEAAELPLHSDRRSGSRRSLGLSPRKCARRSRRKATIPTCCSRGSCSSSTPGIAKRGPDTAVGVHVCRGNARYGVDGTPAGMRRIADTVQGGMNVDHFLLEYDDERSGDFAPLAAIPKGKRVVLGLVTSKHGTLEDPSALKRRIEEAARYIPLENLALSPQCGFASTHEGNIITPADQWSKLKLVVDVARDVWG